MGRCGGEDFPVRLDPVEEGETEETDRYYSFKTGDSVPINYPPQQ